MSCRRSSRRRRSAKDVPAQASCARRARANASSTSGSVDWGMCASGAPLSGEIDSLVSPEVATSRLVSAST
jgi:hypothetical protein